MTIGFVARARDRFASRRRSLAVLAAAPLLAIGAPCAANAAGKKRVAFLVSSPREWFLAEPGAKYSQALADLGWVEGKNLEILWRFTEGDDARVPEMVKEIVAAKPDVIWVAGFRRTRAFQQSTRSIPIVALVPDPVRDGFAKSLPRPGGNITGLSLGVNERQEKMLELLRLVLPRLQAVALIMSTAGAEYCSRFPADNEDLLESRLTKSRIEWKTHGVGSIEELRSILRALPGDGRGAAFLWPPMNLDPRAVAQAAIDLRVPTIAEAPGLVEAGLLMSYTLYHDDETRRMVVILDKLLRGADPATIPFELPTKSRFAINSRTAAAIGVALPAEVVLRADKVYE